MDGLSLAVLCLLATAQQGTDFCRPTDQRCDARDRRSALEARCGGILPVYPVDLHRFRDPFERAVTDGLEVEARLHQPGSVLADQHRVWLRELLQARRKVWRLSDRGLNLSDTFADEIANDDQSGLDADARRQASASGRFDVL